MIDDILLRDLRTAHGPGRRHALYYYAGNFYYPTELHGSDAGRVRQAMRRFERENAERVRADRAAPGYRTKLQLFDEKPNV